MTFGKGERVPTRNRVDHAPINYKPPGLAVTDETYKATKLWDSEQRRAEALALEWK